MHVGLLHYRLVHMLITSTIQTTVKSLTESPAQLLEIEYYNVVLSDTPGDNFSVFQAVSLILKND